MPIASILPTVYIPPQDVIQFLRERSKPLNNHVLLVDGPTGKEYTCSDLWSASSNLTNGLRANGLVKGEVAVAVLPNCPEYAMVLLGVIEAGGILSGANPAYTERELEHHFKDSGAKFVFTMTSLLSGVRAAAAKLGSQIKNIYVIDQARPSGRTKPFSDLLRYPSTPVVPAEPTDIENDLCLLPYSSGTTGGPKGVMLTHRNIVAALCILNGGDPAVAPTSDDVSIAVLPFYHIYGCVAMIYGFLRGHKQVVLPKFDPNMYLHVIQKFRATKLYVVPPILLFLAKHPLTSKYDLSSLRQVNVGAAPVGKELCIQFQEKFPHVERLMQGYGMTESPLATLINAPSYRPVVIGSCGIVSANVLIKVVSLETDEELGQNQDGELLVKGPNIMKGYLNKPQQTREMLLSDGWLRTGDIGHYDEHGLFYIVDRRKELIKVKGLQVPPAELEDLILSHPGVSDVAVIGIPDGRTGEAPKAFVVKTDRGLTEEDIKNHVKDRVASFKQLRGGVEFVDSIPKSPAGKILRRFLRQQTVKPNSKL